MKKAKIILTNFMIAVGLVSLVAVPTVAAENPFFKGCTEGTICDEAKKPDQAGTLIKDVINILLYVLGAIAVIVIVVGGIRYATSDGDSSKIKGAKDSILYAVVGLIVAMLAYAIVNFVLTSFGGSSGGNNNGGNNQQQNNQNQQQSNT